MTSLRSLYANRWVRYALTLLLLAAVAVKVDVGRLASAAGSANPGYLAVALALTIPFLALKTFRWYLMLGAADIDATAGEAVLSLLGGMGLALITPARLGELVRVAYLRDGRKLRIGGLVMIDKALDVVVLCALSIAGAWVLLGAWAGLAFLGASLAGLLLLHHPGHVAGTLRRVSLRTPLQTRLDGVWDSLASLSPRVTTIFLSLTVAAFVVVLLQFAVILLSWRGWSPDIVILTFPLVILTNVLPITIGGLGVREAASAILLSHFGVPPSEAALAAFLMFGINTALPGLLGAALLPPAAVPSAARPMGLFDRS